MANAPVIPLNLSRLLGSVFVTVRFGHARAGSYKPYVVNPAGNQVVLELPTVRLTGAPASPNRISDSPLALDEHYVGINCGIQAVQTDPDGVWSVACDVYQQDVAEPARLRHVLEVPALTGKLTDGSASTHFFLKVALG